MNPKVWIRGETPGKLVKVEPVKKTPKGGRLAGKKKRKGKK